MLTNVAGANTLTVLMDKGTVISVKTDSAEALKVDPEHHSLESRPGLPTQLSRFALQNIPISGNTRRQR